MSVATARPGDTDQRPDTTRPCSCRGCVEFRAIHAGFCAEPSRAERAAKRAADRAAQRRYEDAVIATTPLRRAG